MNINGNLTWRLDPTRNGLWTSKQIGGKLDVFFFGVSNEFIFKFVTKM